MLISVVSGERGYCRVALATVYVIHTYVLGLLEASWYLGFLETLRTKNNFEPRQYQLDT